MTPHGDTRPDLSLIVLPRWGAVMAVNDAAPWLVVDPNGVAVEPIRRFLLDLVARDSSPASVRSYAFGLLRWWRWLHVAGVDWEHATTAETRDLVLWMRLAHKPIRSQRTASTATAGTTNPITRKPYLDDRYKPRTVRHSNAVIRSFYSFWNELGEGPVVNPVPLGRGRGRANAHHNPLEPFRPQGRIRYNPKVPHRTPRAIPDEQWIALFSGLRSNRDRAILAVTVSNGARAAELLGVRSGVDLDWGEQLVRVVRKGTRAEQWLPVSPEAFVWIRLYLADLGAPLPPNQPLWQTLRRRDHGSGLTRQPLSYDALRAVFRRVNTLLGTNWSMHDLRYTAALRMSRDSALSMRDVQVILGHAHLSTTADIYLAEDQTEVIERVHQHLQRRVTDAAAPPVAPAAGYDAADLNVLFGEGIR
ncbi:tyrosine-type recombinase/integrase [Nocardia sp. NPDC050408]|uniref:tyrosine-type recombinase/integrase n=1 Tax=Nocardia sp. NPDC050408 TaxID=3364319 RepID=UPI0037B60C8F